MDYSFLELLGDVGGLMDALLVLISLFVYQVSDVHINCRIIKLFDFLLKKEEENPFSKAAQDHHSNKSHPNQSDSQDYEGGILDKMKLKSMLTVGSKPYDQFQSFKF